jgi:hypothetical protein
MFHSRSKFRQSQQAALLVAGHLSPPLPLARTKIDKLRLSIEDIEDGNVAQTRGHEKRKCKQAVTNIKQAMS